MSYFEVSKQFIYKKKKLPNLTINYNKHFPTRFLNKNQNTNKMLNVWLLWLRFWHVKWREYTNQCIV